MDLMVTNVEGELGAEATVKGCQSVMLCSCSGDSAGQQM
jgi:hypothetical protein